MGSSASERWFQLSQSVFTFRQTRLTVSLLTAPPNRACPREGVWSLEIGEGFERGDIGEAFQFCMIIVMDELVQEGVAISVVGEQPMPGAALLFPADGLCDAAVEALDHAVGLRLERLGEAVLDLGIGTNRVEGVAAGRLAFGLALHVDGEAVSELGTVIGEDGMHDCRELGEEALEEDGRRLGVAAGMDLDPRLRGDKHRPRELPGRWRRTHRICAAPVLADA